VRQMNVKLTLPETVDVRITKNLMRVWQKSDVANHFAISVTRWTSIVMLALTASVFTGVFLTPEYKIVAVKSAIVSIVAACIGRIANEPVARLASRSRPFEELRFAPLAEHGRGKSFPSNHSTGAFALAIGCAHVPGYNIVLLVLAVLLAMSRIYCGLHYASDVLAGAIHGILAASICLWMMFWL
jgi:undecaprenyl-diphosphatase